MEISREDILGGTIAEVWGDRSSTSAEALVRWNHPEMGLLQPGQFIGLAEETGLVMQLGRWVLFTATKQLALWWDRPNFFVTINLSA
jgi:EAL domain-containing protein (putative c-di-GMP-specific phosphodiesterase class I)